MIIKEFYRQRSDGVNLYRAYSDNGFYILQNETGAEYDEAIDVEDAPYTYTETDRLPNETNETNDPDEATEQDYINALAELGVTDDEEINS